MDKFATITYTLSPIAEPLFIEDGNTTHGHKSERNYYAKWRIAHRIILMPYPLTSPDMNPIKMC